jgi:3-phenylpropionate/trans-cinnamate dioxygenase ferredoxin subunit
MFHWFKIYDSLEALENNVLTNKTDMFILKGERICIAKGKDAFYAVQEKCPHNGASLRQGFCTPEGEIVCPIHRYKFNLKSGRATAGGSFALKTYPLEIRENGVFVGIKARWWEM